MPFMFDCNGIYFALFMGVQACHDYLERGGQVILLFQTISLLYDMGFYCLALSLSQDLNYFMRDMTSLGPFQYGDRMYRFTLWMLSHLHPSGEQGL